MTAGGPVEEHELDDFCGRCGSSVAYEDCATCEAFGELDPVTFLGASHCDTCGGTGTMRTCLSSVEWCEANPLPGCEDRARHSIPDGAPR